MMELGRIGHADWLKMELPWNGSGPIRRAHAADKD